MIENNGIYLDKNVFDKHYDLNNESFNITDNTIYSHYNLYTTTGRPSNIYNGVNFAAINKTNGSRASFIPKNDTFIEYDFKAYHPTLIAKLVGFELKDETPYEYLARETGLDITEAKQVMLKCLYGGIYDEYKHLEYFKKIQEYIDIKWEEFEREGFVTCPTSGHIFNRDELKNMTPPKLLSYIIQNLETSNNVLIMWDIIKLLRGKNTQIVLYTYDSFCLDVDETEIDIIDSIEHIFTKNKLKTTKKYGNSYEFKQ